MLSWKPPLPEHKNGRLVRYHVIITDAGFTSTRNVTYDITDGRIQLISALHADTSYAVRIAAATGVGIGPFSAIRTVTTLRNGTFVCMYVSTKIICTVSVSDLYVFMYVN